MANRRMVAVRIIDSARFLKMPISTQVLYFHLLARADDDGVIEAFNIMKMTGATEDDLKILASKQYVTVLNEDLVSYINDWQEHNLIRSDRKVDSMYKDLLLQVVSDVRLLEKRERADRKKALPTPSDENEVDGTSQGQTKDGIGYVRLGNVSINKDIYSQASLTEKCKEIIDYLNNKANKNYKYTTKPTTAKIKARLEEGFTIDDFKKVIDIKVGEWLNDAKMQKYLRPETLFGNKFEGYLNQGGEDVGKYGNRIRFTPKKCGEKNTGEPADNTGDEPI